MFDSTSSTQVYLACGTTDGRKSFQGLMAIVKLQFDLDPYSRSMFVFCNKRRNLIKILQWDGSGFWIYIKRLEKAAFQWQGAKSEVKNISIRQLQWLLEGLSMEQKAAFSQRHPIVFL